MSDWTSQQRAIKTPYGAIFYGGPCKDNYRNMTNYDPEPRGGMILRLQGPAMRSFKAAQQRYARQTGWSKDRLDKNPDGRPITCLAGTNRTCSLQASLYRSDSSRYAPPQYTGHTRGLAIDVSQAQNNLSKIYSCLAQEHWHRARSDEPWHWSYFVEI